MTTAPRSRLGRGAAVFVLLASVAVTGCAPTPSTRPPTRTADSHSVPGRDVTGEWNRSLAAAQSNHDLESCRRHFATDAPGWFCDNLLRLPVGVSLVDPGPQGFDSHWCWRLGSECVEKTWVLPYTVAGRDVRLAAPVTQHIRGDTYAPPWALEATRDEHVGAATILLGGDRPVPAGLATAEAGLAAYPFASTPASPLTYALPSSRAAAEAIARDQLERTAALTVPAAPGSRELLIVLNPDEPSAQTAYVLAHEGAHVRAATGTWKHLWAAEGLAETVALTVAPQERLRSDEAVRAYIRAHGVPTALPIPAAFTGNETDAAYGLARIAVEVLVARIGQQPAMDALPLLANDAPASSVTPEQLTQWWRAELEARYR